MFDNYAVDITIEDRLYTLALFDTAGQETFDQIRTIAYQQTDVFLVCFSVVMPSSLTNIKRLWIHEVQRYCPKTPYILVGTKIDLRNNSHEVERLAKKKEAPITREEGERAAKQLKAFMYVECSSLTQVGSFAQIGMITLTSAV